MMKFRKKPVVIEAVRTSEAQRCACSDWKSLPQWLADKYEEGKVVFTPECVIISTPEGTMKAFPGDMIIRGVSGEVYPCKLDIFEKTYERVEE